MENALVVYDSNCCLKCQFRNSGVCQCNEGFGASDCSLDITKPPRLESVLDNGFCDEKETDCSHFGISETLKLHDKETVVDGQADTLVEAVCPLRSLRKRRSTSKENSSEFVFGYQVSISNDGVHFGNKTVNVYIYDSTCQYPENMPGSELRFHLKVGYCYIDGSCVSNGSLSMQQTVVCDTRVSSTSWTPVAAIKPTQKSTEQSQLLTIISSSIGGVLVIIIISLVVIICHKFQTRKKTYRNQRSISKGDDYNELNTSTLQTILDGQGTALENPAYRLGYKTDPDSRLKGKSRYVYYFGKK